MLTNTERVNAMRELREWEPLIADTLILTLFQKWATLTGNRPAVDSLERFKEFFYGPRQDSQ